MLLLFHWVKFLGAVFKIYIQAKLTQYGKLVNG